MGHVGGDDFIIVTAIDTADACCRKIIADFDAAVPALYDPADRERGAIEIADRQGKMATFPLVGIAIGGVTNEIRPLTSIGQISALGAEMKKFVKRDPKSSYAFDKRTY